MHTKYKIVASDLDGTLLDDSSQVSKTNFEAIKKLFDMGIKFIPVTGRTLYEIPESLLNCKYIDFIIYSDGAVIYRKSTNESIGNYFDTRLACNIFRILKQYEAMIEIYCTGHPVTEKSNLNKNAYNYFRIDEYYRPIIDSLRIGVNNLDSFLKEADEIEIFNVFFRNEYERCECQSILRQMDSITFTSSIKNNMEIMKAGTNKGSAILRLAQMLHISTDDIIISGDSKNDISMFKVIKNCLAVKNADEQLKETASDIICSNNENNIDYILKNYIEV